MRCSFSLAPTQEQRPYAHVVHVKKRGERLDTINLDKTRLAREIRRTITDVRRIKILRASCFEIENFEQRIYFSFRLFSSLGSFR